MTDQTPIQPSTAVIDKPAIDPKMINLQIVYSPSNRPGDFFTHQGIMRYPVLLEGPNDADLAAMSAKSLDSPVFVPDTPVPVSLWWHQTLMSRSESYQRDVSSQVIRVIQVRSNLTEPTDSSIDFDEAEALRICAITLDQSWLDKSTADPRPSVMQAVQVAKARLREDNEKIARATTATIN